MDSSSSARRACGQAARVLRADRADPAGVHHRVSRPQVGNRGEQVWRTAERRVAVFRELHHVATTLPLLEATEREQDAGRAVAFGLLPLEERIRLFVEHAPDHRHPGPGIPWRQRRDDLRH